MAKVLKSVLNVCPCRNDGAEHHEAKGEKGHASDGTTEPQDFAVSDQDDGQIFEDSVDGDREELKSFGAGVYHDNESQGYGKPLEVVNYPIYAFHRCDNSHLRASSELKSLYCITPKVLQVWIATTQTTD